MADAVVPILGVRRAARALDWYRKLGFEPVEDPLYPQRWSEEVEVARDGARLRLSELHSGQAFLMLRLPDAAAIASELGADLRDTDADEGVFEVSDPDGNRIRLVER